MANGNIDPAMRSATVLQNSQQGGGNAGFDRAIKEKQLSDIREKEKRTTIEKGLGSLNKVIEDMKVWEEQQGFKEIMDDHQKVIDVYLNLSKKGLNLVAPKSEQEIKAYKAIQDSHSRIIQKVNTWDSNKKQYDALEALAKTDLARSPDEQKIDWEKTYANRDAQYSKSILDRKEGLNNLLVYKYDISDVLDYGALIKDKMEQPNRNVYQVTDPDNTVRDVIDERLTKEQKEANKKRMASHYSVASPELKEAVKKLKEKDPVLGMLSDEEYFTALNMPDVKEEWSSKLRSKADDGKVSFLGQKKAIAPAEKMDNPIPFGGRTYSERYQFASSPTYTVPVGNISSYHAGMANKETGSDGWRPVGDAGGAIEATLWFYDPKSDSFVFRTTQANQTPPFTSANTTFAVPRSIIGSQADKLPVVDDEGNVTELKTVYPKEDKNKKEQIVDKGWWNTDTTPKKKSAVRPPLKL